MRPGLPVKITVLGIGLKKTSIRVSILRFVFETETRSWRSVKET